MLGDKAQDYLLHHCSFQTVLDIGSGTGEHARIFAQAGKSVTRFDYGKSVAFDDPIPGVIIGDFLSHDFKGKFDLVWASHVLEHSLYTHDFLVKVLEITTSESWVSITVPPAKPEFVGGHVTLWTPALLIYRMVLAGFDCSHSVVLLYGYNISVVTKAARNTLKIADLAWDRHDISRISRWLPSDLNACCDGSRYGTYVSGDSQNFFM